jgi:hypothetical protein
MANIEGYYTFHIIMPFSRKYTQEFYINELRKFNIIWHPVSEKPYDWPNEDWIQPLVYDKTGMEIVSSPYFAFRKFVEGFKIVDNDYYFMMSDDDFLEPDFFNKLRHRRKYHDHPNSLIDTDFIIVSLMRGHHMVPTSAYPNDILLAHPSNMRLFWISMSQVIIKGKILKDTYLKCPLSLVELGPDGNNYRYIFQREPPYHGPCGDGLYIQYLWNTYPGSHFTFVDEACQWFNYLEPGRWDGAPILDNYKHINTYDITTVDKQ